MGVFATVKSTSANPVKSTVCDKLELNMSAEDGPTDEREEGEIIDEFEDIISSDEEFSMRQRIEELEATNAELEKIENISGVYGIASYEYPKKDPAIHQVDRYPLISIDISDDEEYPPAPSMGRVAKRRKSLQNHSCSRRKIIHGSSSSHRRRKKSSSPPPAPLYRPADRVLLSLFHESVAGHSSRSHSSKRKRKGKKSHCTKTSRKTRDYYISDSDGDHNIDSYNVDVDDSYENFNNSDADRSFSINRDELRVALARNTHRNEQHVSLKDRLIRKKENTDTLNEKVTEDPQEVVQEESKPSSPQENTETENNSEEQELRIIALKSAVIRKHLVRKKRNENVAYSPSDFDEIYANMAISPSINNIDETEACNSMEISPVPSPKMILSDDDGMDTKPVDMDIANSDSDCELPSYEKWVPIEQIPLPDSIGMAREIYVPTVLRYNGREKGGLMPPQVAFESASVSPANLEDSEVEEEEVALRALLLAKMNSPKVNKIVKEEPPKVPEVRTTDPDVSLEAEVLRNFLINNMKKKAEPTSSSASVLKEAVRRLTARNASSSPAEILTESSSSKTWKSASKTVEETEMELDQAITGMARVKIRLEKSVDCKENVQGAVLNDVSLKKIVKKEHFEVNGAEEEPKEIENSGMSEQKADVVLKVAVKREGLEEVNPNDIVKKEPLEVNSAKEIDKKHVAVRKTDVEPITVEKRGRLCDVEPNAIAKRRTAMQRADVDPKVIVKKEGLGNVKSKSNVKAGMAVQSADLGSKLTMERECLGDVPVNEITKKKIANVDLKVTMKKEQLGDMKVNRADPNKIGGAGAVRSVTVHKDVKIKVVVKKEYLENVEVCSSDVEPKETVMTKTLEDQEALRNNAKPIEVVEVSQEEIGILVEGKQPNESSTSDDAVVNNNKREDDTEEVTTREVEPCGDAVESNELLLPDSVAAKKKLIAEEVLSRNIDFSSNSPEVVEEVEARDLSEASANKAHTKDNFPALHQIDAIEMTSSLKLERSSPSCLKKNKNTAEMSLELVVDCIAEEEKMTRMEEVNEEKSLDVEPLKTMAEKENSDTPTVEVKELSSETFKLVVDESQGPQQQTVAKDTVISVPVGSRTDMKPLSTALATNGEKPSKPLVKKPQTPTFPKKTLPVVPTIHKPISKTLAHHPTTSRTKIVKPNKVINQQTTDLKRKTTDSVATSSAPTKKLKTEDPLNRLITKAEMPKVKELIIQLRASDTESEYSAMSADDYDDNVDGGSPISSFLNRSTTIGNEYYDIASPISLPMESPCDTPTRAASPLVSIAPSPQLIVEKSIVNDFFEAKLDQFLKNVRSKVADSTKKPVEDAAALVAPVNTPVAVRHLPEASQQEYRRLINRIKMLERQKQAKSENVRNTTGATTEGGSRNVLIDGDDKNLARKVLVKNATVNSAKPTCDKTTVVAKSFSKPAPQKRKTPEKIAGSKSAMNPSKAAPVSTLKPSNENLLGLYENSYRKTGTSIILNLDKSIEMVRTAKDAKMAKLKYEHRMKELRKEMEEVQRNIQQQQECITKIYPEICSSHRLIESLKTRREKINKAVTTLGRNVVGPNYSMNDAQKSIISEKLKKLAAEIKSVNNMTLSDVEKSESQNCRSSIDNAAIVAAAPKDLNCSTVKPSPAIKNQLSPITEVPVGDSESPIINKTVDISVPEITQEMEPILSDTIVPETISNKEDPNDSTNGHEEALEIEPVGDKQTHDPPKVKDAHEDEKERGGGAKLQDYVSPLSHLRDERQINPNGIVCPYQLMGQCDDKDCKYMHLDE